MSTLQVRNGLLGPGWANVLSQRFQISRLHRFGHALQMGNAHLPYHAVHPTERKKSHGGQRMT